MRNSDTFLEYNVKMMDYFEYIVGGPAEAGKLVEGYKPESVLYRFAFSALVGHAAGLSYRRLAIMNYSSIIRAREHHKREQIEQIKQLEAMLNNIPDKRVIRC